MASASAQSAEERWFVAAADGDVAVMRELLRSKAVSVDLRASKRFNVGDVWVVCSVRAHYCEMAPSFFN